MPKYFPDDIIRAIEENSNPLKQITYCKFNK